MTEASITVDSNGDIKIARITGQLDESNVDEKVQELYKIVEEVPKGLKLILDLEGLEYMNSKSIGYITDLYGKITESGGKVALAQPQANILDILQVVGLTQLIESFDNIESAKASVNGEVPVPAQTPEAPATEVPAPMSETPTEATPAAEQPATESAPPTPATPTTPAQEIQPEPIESVAAIQTPEETTPATEQPAEIKGEDLNIAPSSPTPEPAPQSTTSTEVPQEPQTPEATTTQAEKTPEAPDQGTYKFEG